MPPSVRTKRPAQPRCWAREVRVGAVEEGGGFEGGIGWARAGIRRMKIRRGFLRFMI